MIIYPVDTMENCSDRFFNENLVAPCGMNCGVCYAYLREKDACGGCRSVGKRQKHCEGCNIRECWRLRDYCDACEEFPCATVKRLDKRYRTRYGVSLLENLKRMRAVGVSCFLEEEAEQWRCSGCGKITTIHQGKCLFCDHERSIV